MSSGLDKLLAGFDRFKDRYYVQQPELYEQLVSEGQFPKSIIIGCCDSRVHPAQILDTEPGEVFVVRNVANLVPACVDDGKTHGTSAALEFAVIHLKVEHIVILGHGQCGGIKHLMKDEPVAAGENSFIEPWMQIVAPAKNRILATHADKPFEEQCKLCEQEAVSLSMANLMTFPFVKEAVQEKRVTIHGWHFDIESGELTQQ